MILRLMQAVDAATLDTLRTIAGQAAFAPGAKTAGWAARGVKQNSQIPAGPAAATLARTVEAGLRAHPVFLAAAQPKSFCKILVSRYTSGMAYGTHIDEPVIGGQRADLSFTLFLSDPEAYDGGALVLDSQDGETAMKLAAGDAVLYPTTMLHRVDEVTRGTRLAAVGWVRSFIRLEAQRSILFDLDQVAREMFDRDGKTHAFDCLTQAKANLMRLWAED